MKKHLNDILVQAHRPDARADREGHRPRQLHVGTEARDYGLVDNVIEQIPATK